jgi:hypothetical protein
MNKEEYYKVSDDLKLPRRCPIYQYCHRRLHSIINFSFYKSNIKLKKIVEQEGFPYDKFKQNEIIHIGYPPTLGKDTDFYFFSDACPEVTLFSSQYCPDIFPDLAISDGSYVKEQKKWVKDYEVYKHYSECSEFSSYKYPQKSEMKVNMKKMKLFLASSSELAEERKEVESIIRKENDKLIENDEYIKLIVWEDLEHTFHKERVQKRFNEYLLKSDYVVFMFYSKLGKYSKEEFDIAVKSFTETGKPKILVLFKELTVKSDDINDDILNINKFKKIIKTNEQIYKDFNNNDQLKNILKQQIDLYLQSSISNDKPDYSSDFKFKIDLNYSQSFTALYSGDNIDNELVSIQVNVTNIGNKPNCVDRIQFSSIKDNTRKYYNHVTLNNDEYMKVLLPDYGIPINVGKKESYNFPIVDMIDAITNDDNQLEFKVIVYDGMGNTFEGTPNKQVIDVLTKYCYKKKLIIEKTHNLSEEDIDILKLFIGDKKIYLVDLLILSPYSKDKTNLFVNELKVNGYLEKARANGPSEMLNEMQGSVKLKLSYKSLKLLSKLNLI